MKLIDVTNSHSDLVTKQLENTDSNRIKVYSLGPSTVFYSEAVSHKNLIIVNKSRPVRQKELDFVIIKLFPQCKQEDLEVLRGLDFIEVEYKI